MSDDAPASREERKPAENGDSPRQNKGGRVPIFRSLVWLVPERAARRIAWAVVILCAVVPLALVLALIARQAADRPESRLASLLTKRLATGVRLGAAAQEAPGHYELRGVRMDDFALACAVGGYHAPAGGLGGRLDLENGSFALDLDAFAKAPPPRLQKLLEDARLHDDLHALSLSGFTGELALLGKRAALGSAAASVERTAAGSLRGALTARAGQAPLRLIFEIAPASQSVTVSAGPLPWAKPLLAPTLGEALAGLLDVGEGTLTIGSALATGAEGDAWQMAANASLDLARLPAEFGLEGIAGRVEMTLAASGPLGKPATVNATLWAPKGGRMSAAALSQIAWLFDATAPAADDKKPVAFESLDLVVIITRDQVHVTGPRAGRPAGLYAPGGARLLAIPARTFTLRDFARRLDELKRRWEASHAG